MLVGLNWSKVAHANSSNPTNHKFCCAHHISMQPSDTQCSSTLLRGSRCTAWSWALPLWPHSNYPQNRLQQPGNTTVFSQCNKKQHICAQVTSMTHFSCWNAMTVSGWDVQELVPSLSSWLMLDVRVNPCSTKHDVRIMLCTLRKLSRIWIVMSLHVTTTSVRAGPAGGVRLLCFDHVGAYSHGVIKPIRLISIFF